MRDIVSGFDIIISFVLIFVIFLISSNIQRNNIDKYEYYSHYTKALFLKILFCIAFSLVYIFYYGSGDTEYYYTGTRAIFRLAFKDFGSFLSVMVGNRTPELLSQFDSITGWPTYFKDANSWAVCRFTLPFYLLGGCSYLGTIIVMNFFLFIPIWNFYKMIVKIYPNMSSYAAVALFYFPSVVFWGSGLLKDIWCLVAVLAIYTKCWEIFFKKEFIFRNILLYLFWAYILTSIRPYAFYMVFATTIVWVCLNWLRLFGNKFLRAMFFPFMAILIVLIFFFFMQNISTIAEGKYATVDSMIEQAVIIQDDLTRDYYGDNSFNIGPFDGSIPSMLSKFPQAITAGLYRPFIWEVRSVFMLLSGIEGLIMLIFSAFLLFKLRLKFFKYIINDLFIFSIFIFVLTFAFFVGLTIANFGALVRYKIIFMPFFFIILSHLWLLYKRDKEEEEEELTVIS